MTQKKQPAGASSDVVRDETVVERVNAGFYRAFAARDLEAMDLLWARTGQVCCIHPGWNPLITRVEIMDSWQAILGGPNPPDIRCRAPRVSVHGDTALVVCFEQIADGFLIATNAYRRIDGAWKLVHHQAGPAAAPPEDDDDDDDEPPSPLLN